MVLVSFKEFKSLAFFGKNNPISLHKSIADRLDSVCGTVLTFVQRTKIFHYCFCSLLKVTNVDQQLSEFPSGDGQVTHAYGKQIFVLKRNISLVLHK